MTLKALTWRFAPVAGLLACLTGATGGTAQTLSAAMPDSVAAVRQIALGAEHACAVEPGGGVWCWGANASGQLGLNTTTDQQVPTRLSGLSARASANGLGALFSCVRLEGGGVSCWGDNRRGQLGLGDTTRRLSPAAVPGLSTVSSLALGYRHACAVQSGDLLCWGSNDQWSLGLGDRDNRLSPTRVAGVTDVAQVSAGDHHTCALEAQGSLYCWGYNGYGQVGQGDIGIGSRRTTPGRVGLAARVTAVETGYYHTCAIVEGGTLSCWGRNDNGQLGLGDRNFGRNVPVQVPGLSGIVAVAAGYLHTCALRADGRVACFGRNEHGQLGLGETDVFVTSPTLVPGLSGVTSIAADNLSTCAVTETGALYCWGRNSRGQLGLGDTDDRRRPTLVSGLGDRPTATQTLLSGPERAVIGTPVALRARVIASQGGPATGMVAFRRDGTQFASATLNATGEASVTVATLPMGTHGITARYGGAAGFQPSVSEPLVLSITDPRPDFSGGGSIFALTDQCAPALGQGPHPVVVHFTPSELGGRPSGVSLVWRSGSEHLALWGPMLPSGQFYGGAGRGTWTRFVFYPTRPLVRVVQRQIVLPAGGTDLNAAEELVLRLRVQNFAAVPGCAVTVTAVLRRG